MLLHRVVLGAVFIAALAGLLWLDQRLAARGWVPGACLFPVVVLAGWLAAGELLSLFAARDLNPVGPIVVSGCLAMLAANWAPHLGLSAGLLGPLGWPISMLALAAMSVFVAELFRYREPGRAVERLGVACLALVYVGLLGTFFVQLRFLGDRGSAGVPALAALLVTVKMGDTGAYFTGRLLGRHKLASYLSPAKTIEGGVGGLLWACAGAWLVQLWLAPNSDSVSIGLAPRWEWLVFGLLVGVAGIVGDLAESLVKRDVGRKDSSLWMPGFGGVLDVADSTLFAAPVAYWCFALGLV